MKLPSAKLLDAELLCLLKVLRVDQLLLLLIKPPQPAKISRPSRDNKIRETSNQRERETKIGATGGDAADDDGDDDDNLSPADIIYYCYHCLLLDYYYH